MKRDLGAHCFDFTVRRGVFRGVQALQRYLVYESGVCSTVRQWGRHGGEGSTEELCCFALEHLARWELEPDSSRRRRVRSHTSRAATPQPSCTLALQKMYCRTEVSFFRTISLEIASTVR